MSTCNQTSVLSLHLDVVLSLFGVSRVGLNPSTCCLPMFSWHQPTLVSSCLSACVPCSWPASQIANSLFHTQTPFLLSFIHFNQKRLSSLGILNQNKPNKLRPGLHPQKSRFIEGGYSVVLGLRFFFFLSSLKTLK